MSDRRKFPDKRHRRQSREAQYHKRAELRDANEALLQVIGDLVKERDALRREVDQLKWRLAQHPTEQKKTPPSPQGGVCYARAHIFDAPLISPDLSDPCHSQLVVNSPNSPSNLPHPRKGIL
jgi:hypothetical protein